MTLPAELSERHRVAAQRFTEIVGQASDWDAPTSVAAWRARDVVGHLTSWLPGMLAGTVELPPAASDEHPADAWRAQTDAVQALLDDFATAGVMCRSSTMATCRSPRCSVSATYPTWSCTRGIWAARPASTSS